MSEPTNAPAAAPVRDWLYGRWLGSRFGRRARREAELLEALRPFVEFADLAVIRDSANGTYFWRHVPGEQMQAIPVWFGPTDFGLARAAYTGDFSV